MGARMIGDALRDKTPFIQLRHLDEAMGIASWMQLSSNLALFDANTLQLNIGAIHIIAVLSPVSLNVEEDIQDKKVLLW